MRNLINFLLKNSSWFVFIILQVICFYFIFDNNSFQRSVFLNSSNIISGQIYSVSGEVTSYFGLRQENEELLYQNADLLSQISELKEHIANTESDSMKTEAFFNSLQNDNNSNLQLIPARINSNSVSKVNNYISINKGYKNGLTEDMGVISQKGIVGVVRAVSANYAIIQPVLNPHSQFNCKVSTSNATGTLIWDGKDPRYADLTDFPKFEKFEKGDTIVTSGFSDIFPEGIMVGIVEDYKSQSDDNFYSLKIKLSTDFSSLKNVLLIKNTGLEEKRELEKEIEHNVKK